MTPDDNDISELIRQHATRYQASAALRANVQTQVALADAGRNKVSRGWRIVKSIQSIAWRPAIVGFALGAMAVLSAGPIMQALGSTGAIETELVADHVRVLRAGPLVEVASSDRHTVKPWFQGRVDYAPPVIDLADSGFPLLGGRLERVRGDAVAALVYKRNLHVINLFVWPTNGERANQHDLRKGFNIVHWADSSMQYWLVSDVERVELERFAQAWREKSVVR
jgi:anti-sigma factor RsiW